MDQHPFKVGDLVTRDGSDVHQVVDEGMGFGEIIVECVKAPAGRWIEVGERELNLAGRYSKIEA